MPPGADRLLFRCRDGVTVDAGKFTDSLVTFAYRMLGDWQAAQDCVQKAMTSAWENLQRRQMEAAAREGQPPDGAFFDDEKACVNWLYTIVRNKCRDHIRARRRRNPVLPIDDVVDGVPAGTQDPTDAVAGAELLQKYREARSRELEQDEKICSQFDDELIRKYIREVLWDESIDMEQFFAKCPIHQPKVQEAFRKEADKTARRVEKRVQRGIAWKLTADPQEIREREDKGGLVRALRELLSMRQKELEKELGVAQTHVSYIENVQKPNEKEFDQSWQKANQWLGDTWQRLTMEQWNELDEEFRRIGVQYFGYNQWTGK